MKNGNPELKSRQQVQDSQGRLDRLSALEAWTEQPGREQAAAIAGGEGASGPQPAPTQTRRGPPMKHVRQVPTDDADAPWRMVLEVVPMQQVNFRLPREVYQKLRWLGGTTYGESMNDIALAGIEAEVQRRMSLVKSKEGT